MSLLFLLCLEAGVRLVCDKMSPEMSFSVCLSLTVQKMEKKSKCETDWFVVLANTIMECVGESTNRSIAVWRKVMDKFFLFSF